MTRVNVYARNKGWLFEDLLRRPDLRESGLKTLEFLWDKTWNASTSRFDHAWTPEGGRAGLEEFFVDQAQMLRLLLAAFESTGEARHLERARQVAAAAVPAFADSLNGGFADRVSTGQAVGLMSWPVRSLRDNALFTDALIRLYHHTADDALAKTARKALESWADEFSEYKELSAPFGLAVDHLLNPPLEIILLGPHESPEFAPLAAEARALYHPWRVIRYPGPEEAGTMLKRRQVTPPAGVSCVLCLGTLCSAPASKPEEIKPAMAELKAACIAAEERK